MKVISFLAGLLVVFGVAFAPGVGAGEKKADKPKAEAAKELPPHPLDGAFDGARSEREIVNGLLNNPHFKKAVREAMKKKQEVDRGEKGGGRPSGKTAARQRFLDVLNQSEAER